MQIVMDWSWIVLDRRGNDNHAKPCTIGLEGFIVILSVFYYSLIYIYMGMATAIAVCKRLRVQPATETTWQYDNKC
jgi:hypothetical protein